MTLIDQMLEQYEIKSDYDKKNAIKEITQEITLYGLSKAGFFKEAAFYGGTALRIFYGLDRFSEDLDFSLVTPNQDFDLAVYFPILKKELMSFGLNVEVIEKEKNTESNIKSAFLKSNTKEQFLLFFREQIHSGVHPNELIKIKFKVDVNPPKYAEFKHEFRLLPSPYEIKLYQPSSLFSGKIHAVVCRAWKERIKGRDLYDYVFYISKNIPVNLKHLRERFLDTSFLSEADPFNLDILKEILKQHFDTIDYNKAKEDVLPFIKDPSQLDIWSAEFFKQITDNLKED